MPWPPPPFGLSAQSGDLLVVDDLEGNARLFRSVLEREGHRVRLAADGEEALQLVAERCPDLVLMDVLMPRMDGFEACRRLKSNPSTRLVPIVLVTALQGSADRIRGLEVGADDFISKPVNPAELTARVRSLLRIKRYTDELETVDSVIVSLALTIEARDPSTDGHCQRLSQYAVTLGAELGLGDDDLAALARGGYLHDLGKIAVPDAILLKPASLTPAEYAVMKQHPITGERLCGEMKSLKHVRQIVRHHHERLDGSGYPDGLKGGAIPFNAQIMAIVDVFDALTTARPYRSAMSIDAALDELRREADRGWRDRVLVDALVGAVRAGRFAREWASHPRRGAR